MTALFDAHCHLFPEAVPAPRTVPDSGRVRGRLLCGTDPAGWERLAEAAAAWPGSVPAFGVHPWEAGKPLPADWPDRLESLLRTAPGAWAGECGLDGLKTADAPPEQQAAVFTEQLRLAARLGRSVGIHCVRAWPALMEALDTAYAGRSGGVFTVHSFGGPFQYIDEVTRRGGWFSIGPLSSRHDSPKARERAARLPADRLLLESDAFLVPGSDAEENLGLTLRWLAAARECPAEALAETLAANSRRLFPDV